MVVYVCTVWLCMCVLYVLYVLYIKPLTPPPLLYYLLCILAYIFQVRKAFKFFDREASLRISIEGFTRALEFLGFQFSESQNTALFGR
jgi:hypothetical protein